MGTNSKYINGALSLLIYLSHSCYRKRLLSSCRKCLMPQTIAAIVQNFVNNIIQSNIALFGDTGILGKYKHGLYIFIFMVLQYHTAWLGLVFMNIEIRHRRRPISTSSLLTIWVWRRVPDPKYHLLLFSRDAAWPTELIQRFVSICRSLIRSCHIYPGPSPLLCQFPVAINVP